MERGGRDLTLLATAVWSGSRKVKCVRDPTRVRCLALGDPGQQASRGPQRSQSAFQRRLVHTSPPAPSPPCYSVCPPSVTDYLLAGRRPSGIESRL